MANSAKWPQEPNEFAECESCRSKPGSPAMCGPCLHNRALIERLRAEVARCHRELERVSDRILATDVDGDRARAEALAVCRAAAEAIKAMA